MTHALNMYDVVKSADVEDQVGWLCVRSGRSWLGSNDLFSLGMKSSSRRTLCMRQVDMAGETSVAG